MLARYAGKVVTRAHLSRSVWGIHSEQRIHDLQVLVAQLREKLAPHGEAILISTLESIGYGLSLSAHAAPASSRVIA